MSTPIKPITMRDAFLSTMYDRMEKDERIFFLAADFGAPTLDKIREKMPDRFLNVGIAEQNLINVSAGLSLEGYIVFAYAIAPFITMRCYEQTRINLALLSEVRELNVNLVGVGAGYSYVVSGPTHQCLEDLTVMRAMPNMQVYSPAEHITAASLVDECISRPGPKYLRFDVQALPVLYGEKAPDLANGFNVHSKGKDLCFVATGYMVHTARKVAGELQAAGQSVGVIDLFSLSNYSREALQNELKPYGRIVTLEEGVHGRGGLDALIGELVNRYRLPGKMLTIGVEGGFRFDLGSRESLHENVGIGANSVMKRVKEFAA